MCAENNDQVNSDVLAQMFLIVKGKLGRVFHSSSQFGLIGGGSMYSVRVIIIKEVVLS